MAVGLNSWWSFTRWHSSNAASAGNEGRRSTYPWSGCTGFLRAGTYTATAERLVLHKNSVQYRIRKAEEALGGRIDDRRVVREFALRGRQYLGQAVLRPVGSGSGTAGLSTR